MSILLASILGMSVAQVASSDRVMICYLASADITNPKELNPTGAFRLLVFRFPSTTEPYLNGASVLTHDPTGILLGRPIKGITFLNDKGGLGVMTEGRPDDAVSLVVMPPDAGETSAQAAVMRTEKGKPIDYVLVGSCGLPDVPDAEAAFNEFKTLPDTRQ